MRGFRYLPVLLLLAAATFTAVPVRFASAASSACIAHRPLYVAGTFEVNYSSGCTGHDEPELDPISSAAGSAKDLTWTVILPSDGSVPVSAVGPTFWFGGTVTDPNSLFGQAFVELQFYPDAIVSNCTPGGGFVVSNAPNTFTVCSPVWELTQTGQKGVFHETAAFNAMLTDGSSESPLVMHAGDTVTIHWFTTSTQDGFHVTVKDLETGHSGTIVLNSAKDGPLMPAFDAQTIGGSLAWGAVHDTPNSFVWEIGHTSPFTSPASEFCFAGDPECLSYDAQTWEGIRPLTIVSVTFGDSSGAKSWAAVSDLGGISEVLNTCSTYGAQFCIYPWFTQSKTGFHFGVDYPGTTNDFGSATQFAQTALCGGPFGPDSTYCDTMLK